MCAISSWSPLGGCASRRGAGDGGQPRDLFVERALRECGREQVEAVEGTCELVELDAHAGLEQSVRVAKTVVTQWIELGGHDVGGWEPGGGVGPSRRGV